ncbi:cysteine desulfurase family protein [Butyrivibrio sp. JL13D10]|uniref:cysteine desulfurase family protein n=1 Tax=Butyrivibrio sp. JL13D10 TaxID=3236815 RepID=UPI0038B5DECD
MEIYLDNSATTKVYPDVVDLCVKTMMEDYGNASSMHHKGVVSENYIKTATEQIAKTLKAKPKEILFTSGGTESDNIAVIGGAMAHHREGKHLITTQIEHPAILNSMKYLESQGFEVTYLGVSEEGLIDLEELKSAIREDTILVSIMAVNNEIGAKMPLEEAGKIIHQTNPRTIFHVDAVQGYGKEQLIPKQLGIDMMSVSGHKIHSPKGIGFLYIRDGVRIVPITYGGGQQGGFRSGTLNVPGIAGLGRASEETYEGLSEKLEGLYDLKFRLIKGLTTELPDIRINGIDTSYRKIADLSDDELRDVINNTAPHIISVAVKGVRAEVLLHALEDREIYVSAGSACSSNHPQVSGTLKAIKIPKEFYDSTVRISMSEFTTSEQIDETIKAFKEIVPRLREFSRR